MDVSHLLLPELYRKEGLYVFMLIFYYCTRSLASTFYEVRWTHSAYLVMLD